MSVFTPEKRQAQTKVSNSQYIKTENKPDEETTKPDAPAESTQPESK
jgi:hypothetical protein